MLTNRDIVTGVVAAQNDPQTLRVADVMSRNVVTARKEDSVLDALATMRRRGVRRLPVVGAQDRLIGLLTIDDVLQLLAEQMQALAAAVGAAQRHEEVASS
jgi:CBS domain-containing protein